MKTARLVSIVLLCLALLLASTSCSKNEESPQDGQTTDTTAPSAPTKLTCTSPCNDSTPTFTWDAATDDDSGVDYYQTSIPIDAGGVGSIWANIGNATTYTCNAALSEGSHTFRVAAVDEAGNVGDAASLDFTIDTASPEISSITASGVSTSGVVITWTTNEAATSQVQYGTTSSYGSSSPLDSSLVTTHNVSLTGLTADTTYHYRVKSKKACGNESSSGDETFATASLFDDTPPSVPTGLVLATGVSIDPVSGKESVWIRGDWINSTDTGSGMAYYNVEYWVDTASRQTGAVPQPTSGTPYFIIQGCLANTLYNARIRAVDRQFNPSDWCATVSITSSRDTTGPTAPASAIAFGVPGGIRISWATSVSPDTAQYIVYRHIVNNPGGASEVFRGKALNWVDTTAAYATDYYYWVAGVDTSGNIGSKSSLAIGCPIQKGYVSTVDIELDSITSALMKGGIQPYTSTLVFSPKAGDTHDSISWAAGVITFADGGTQNIEAGSFDNIAAGAYNWIYFTIGSTALLRTTTMETAVGKGNEG